MACTMYFESNTTFKWIWVLMLDGHRARAQHPTPNVEPCHTSHNKTSTLLPQKIHHATPKLLSLKIYGYICSKLKMPYTLWNSMDLDDYGATNLGFNGELFQGWFIFTYLSISLNWFIISFPFYCFMDHIHVIVSGGASFSCNG
jgi:hypothetical protein